MSAPSAAATGDSGQHGTPHASHTTTALPSGPPTQSDPVSRPQAQTPGSVMVAPSSQRTSVHGPAPRAASASTDPCANPLLSAGQPRPPKQTPPAPQPNKHTSKTQNGSSSKSLNVKFAAGSNAASPASSAPATTRRELAAERDALAAHLAAAQRELLAHQGNASAAPADFDATLASAQAETQRLSSVLSPPPKPSATPPPPRPAG